MSDNPNDQESPNQSVPGGPGERVVYVIPEQASGSPDDEVSLRELWNILWRGRWIIILVTALFAVGSVLFALSAEEWYRAETVLAPADERATPSLGGQLGGLAALAGVNVTGSNVSQAIATLQSRELAREFIEANDLVKLFFAEQWDSGTDNWIGDDPSQWPDVRSAIEYFRDRVLHVSHDGQSGLVTLTIEWKDPETAAGWATELVGRANSTLRERALRKAEANVAYLREELSQTSVLTLQQSIGRLLESELQQLMLARGSEEFAFRVIDRASAPRERVRPRRVLISLVGTIAGAVFSTFTVLLLHAWRKRYGL